jgi:large subunit ribosomal protein L9
MKVILLEDIEKIGAAGEVVNVADGFSRNYLFPNKKALEATEGSLKQYEHRKRAIEKVRSDKKAAAETIAKQLEKETLEIKAQVGDEGKLFGSVTTIDLYHAFQEKNLPVERKQISIPGPFKEVGTYSIKVRLHPEVEVTIQLVIS